MRDSFGHTISIGAKFTILICGLVLLSSSIVGFWTYSQYNQAITDRDVEELGSLSRIHGERFIAHIGALRSDVRFLSKVPPVAAIMRALATDDLIDPQSGDSLADWQDRMNTIFLEMMHAKPHYFQIRYIGVADGGRELVRVDRLGEDDNARIVTGDKLQRKGDTHYFRSALQYADDEIYLSPIELNREKGVVVEPHVCVLRAAVPVYDQKGAPQGIIIINQNVSFDFEVLQRFTPKDRHLYITNENGQFLVYTTADGESRFDFNQNISLRDEYPDIASTSERMVSNNMTGFVTQDDDSLLVYSFEKVAFDPSNPDRYLGFIVTSGYERVTAATTAIRNQAFAVNAVILLAVLIVGFLFSNYLTAPLRKISQAVQAFGRGEAVHGLPTDAGSEPGTLARAFGKMIEQVEQRTNALSDAEAKHRAIFSTAIDAIITIDVRGNIESANPATTSLFGYELDEIVGQNIKMLMPTPYQQEHDGYLATYRSTGPTGNVIGSSRRVDGQRKDGTIFPLELSVSEVRMDDSRVLLTGIVRDVSERVKADEKLLDSVKALSDAEARHRAILSTAIDAIITIDVNGDIESANTATTNLFGYEPDEMIGQNIRMLMPAPYRQEHDGYLVTYRKSGPTGRVIGSSRRVDGQRKDGSTFPIELSVSEVRLDGGEVLLTGIIRDVSEQVEAEERLKASVEDLNEKNKEMEQFAYSVSHDLKSPLVSIAGLVDCMRDDIEDGQMDMVPESMDRILRNVTRMEACISDLLQLSQVGRIRHAPEFLNMSELVSELAEDLRPQLADMNVTLEIEPDLPSIVGDPVRVNELFLNLLTNAIKYGSGGDKPTIHFGSTQAGSEIRFFVRDNGLGIPEQYHARVFELFQRLDTNEQEGTGVGLAIVTKIMEIHNGRAWVESIPGEGATFWTAFPANLACDINGNASPETRAA